MVVLFSVFWRTSILFFIVTAPIYVTTNSVQEFPFLHGLTNTCFLPFWYCPFQWMWSDISSLWFTFPWWVVMLSIFSCACRPSVCLLWKMWIQTFCPFFNQIVDWFVYLFIYFAIVYQIRDLQIFLWFSRLPFHFVDAFLCCAEAFYLK